jgi:hypothetical protein
MVAPKESCTMTTKKSSRALQVPSKVLSKCGGVLDSCARFFETNVSFLNRDESLVRLAKAFAGKDMCLAFGYE